MREKLIEAVGSFKFPIESCGCTIGEYIVPYSIQEPLVDHLIASGVVVSKMETTTDEDNNVTSNTEDIYPLVIICDRYTGAYSGGKYTAWNHDLEDIPPEIDGDDVDCRNFWWGGEADKYNVGKGSTIAEAVMDLARKLPKGE